MAQSTVEGFEAFRSHMAPAEGSYVVIGGIACDILLSEADLPFRATHDFDTVLIADAGPPEAAKAIWSLVRDGKYRCGWGSDENTCFYRFTEPQTPGFPKMVEVFSKTPDFLGGTTDFEIAPLHIDDEVSSLSAIMLDDAYYQFMLGGVKTVVGVSLLDESHLIPFKAKAYLDLKTRKEKGEPVDSNKIKKHQRDALRLAQLLTGEEKLDLPAPIARDMAAFLSDCEQSQINLKQIGVRGLGMADAVGVMRQVYL